VKQLVSIPKIKRLTEEGVSNMTVANWNNHNPWINIKLLLGGKGSEGTLVMHLVMSVDIKVQAGHL